MACTNQGYYNLQALALATALFASLLTCGLIGNKIGHRTGYKSAQIQSVNSPASTNPIAILQNDGKSRIFVYNPVFSEASFYRLGAKNDVQRFVPIEEARSNELKRLEAKTEKESADIKNKYQSLEKSAIRGRYFK